jgi:hypothetical protein
MSNLRIFDFMLSIPNCRVMVATVPTPVGISMISTGVLVEGLLSQLEVRNMGQFFTALAKFRVIRQPVKVASPS